jgi:hypothetical protein
MRLVYVCACIAFGIVLPCLATESAASGLDAAPSPHTTPDVTVVLDIRGLFSLPAMLQMEKEAGDIIASSGIHLEWRTRDDAARATFNDLVVLTFKGACALEPAPPVYDELGPYAFTRTENGEIQPFGEVNCDHVVGSARAAMSGRDFANADLLIGRALGRVVAHELVHMLTRSGEHARDGIQKPALSGRQLIANSLNLSVLDIDRLRKTGLKAPVAPINPDTDTQAESEIR